MIAGTSIENGLYEPGYAPSMGWFVIHKLGCDIVYRSRDIIGAPKL